MAAMLSNASLIITAWDGEILAGISRALTDFCYVTSLADLAVRVWHQRKCIGRELVRRTQAAGGAKTMLLLLAAPPAAKDYLHVGYDHRPHAWRLQQGDAVQA